MLRRWSNPFRRFNERPGLAAPARLALAFVLFTSPSAAIDDNTPAQSQETPCTLQPGAVGTVSRIIDAETFALTDGSEVRLIGALAPRARDNRAGEAGWPAESVAVETLTTLVQGRTVQLSFGATRKDRYGRLLAHVFLDPKGERTWVQGALLSQGMARAYALPGAGECLSELLANERAAREGNIGLWSELPYRPIRADRTGLLLARRSTFQIVTGEVLAVSRTRNTVYLNFGSDWHSDFSVRIPLNLAKAHPDWNAMLDDLKGKTIEVRGWIERSNGPLIEISQPGELVSTEATSLNAHGADREEPRPHPMAPASRTKKALCRRATCRPQRNHLPGTTKSARSRRPRALWIFDFAGGDQAASPTDSPSLASLRLLALLESTSVIRCTAPRSSSFSTAAISRAMRSRASS